MSKNNMNQNIVTLDGMEKIEVNPLDKPMYLPSKSKVTTERDQIQATREPLTREDFIKGVGAPQVAHIEMAISPVPVLHTIDLGTLYPSFMNQNLCQEIPCPTADSSFVSAAPLKSFWEWDFSATYKDPTTEAISAQLIKDIDEMILANLDEGIKELQDDLRFVDGRVSTNIPELDFILDGGLLIGGLTLIGSPAGVGKSALIREMCVSLARDDTKFVAAFGEVPLQLVIDEMYTAVQDEFDSYLIAPHKNVRDLISELRETLNEPGAYCTEVVMVDDGGMFMDEGDAILGMELRRLARDYNVAVVLTTGMSRQSHYSGDPLWSTTSMRIMSQADVAIQMQRQGNTGWTEMKIVKDRNSGVLGTTTYFDPASRLFCPF
jgi:archaellum biogenesis ATPase FlaH